MKKFLIKQILLLRNKSIKLDYHLVEISPWPLLARMGLINILISIVFWLNNMEVRTFLCFTSVNLLLLSLLWWRDVSREASIKGCHTSLVSFFITFGIVLFIVREVFFFFCFFWSFVHYFKGVDTFILGGLWPPKSLPLFNPRHTPLLNSFLLLRSGVCLTYRHFALLNINLNKTKIWLFFTILLGFIFTFLQRIEYLEASITITDSRFGGIFFIGTGFHGVHVLVGSSFLIFILLRLNKGLINSEQHTGFNNRAWYWHFVDVVWLSLYVLFYWLVIR